MATRVVEGKKPYTGGEAIDINQNKVISLKLRDENNLIIYDSGDDEIYVDLQLPDGIEPLDAFPVGVTTGRVLVADDWDVTGTLICAKTTSGDNIKILYGDNGTLRIDNGTGTFKQIYLKSDTDALLLALRNYIDGELAKKQNGVASATAPVNPSIGDLWYDMSHDVLKVYDGSTWNATGGGGGGTGDVEGPNSATDGHLAVFDGATGKIIKDGGAVPEGVPSGGTDGQVLSKVSGTVAWASLTIPSITTISVTLTTAGWSSNSQTVSATGVTASNSVIVSPNPSDYSDYTDAEIYCSAQGSGTLTFVCGTTPSNNIDVNVVILG